MGRASSQTPPLGNSNVKVLDYVDAFDPAAGETALEMGRSFGVRAGDHELQIFPAYIDRGNGG